MKAFGLVGKLLAFVCCQLVETRLLPVLYRQNGYGYENRPLCNRIIFLIEKKRPKRVNRDIMRRIWQGWIASYLPRLYVALLLMVLVAASASAYPLLTKYIFNGLAEGRAKDIIWMAPPAIIFFALV